MAYSLQCSDVRTIMRGYGMIEKIGKAIAKASRELHMVYGLFDYSSYEKIYDALKREI